MSVSDLASASRWARLLGRSRAESEADELQRESTSVGATPVRECRHGMATTVCGRIRSILVPPASDRPRLEVEVFDGTGLLTVVWLGRRRITGVAPGRTIIVHGRVTCPHGTEVMFNPRYELRPWSSSA